MIKFTRIVIQGFGSIIEPLSYQLDSPGINLILGRNGRGKTTIFSALTWCIWGETLKPDSTIEPWEHLKSQVPTLVRLEFNVGKDKMVIIRSLKHLQLVINDVAQDNYRNKTDTKEAIAKIMGISFRLAKNSLIFGQKLTRLLSEKGEAQKKLFDEAFEAMFINIARENATKDFNKILVEYNELKEQYQTDADGFKMCKKNIKDMKKMFGEQQQGIINHYKEAIKEKSDRIKAILHDKTEYFSLEAQEKKLALEVENLTKKFDKYLPLVKKQFKLDMTVGQDKAERDAMLKRMQEITLILSAKHRTCPVCGQPMELHKYGEVRKSYKNEYNNLNKSLESIKEKIDKDTKELENLNSSLLSYKKLKDTLEGKKKSLELIITQGYDQIEYRPRLVNKVMAEKKKLELTLQAELLKKPDLDWYRDRMKKYKEHALSIKPQYQEKKAKLKLLRWLIDDPLSNKGLKAYIFNSMLSTVNNRLKRYARYTGFTVTLAIDLESGRKNFEATIHKGDHKVPYDDLSGGQKQLVDIALAFSTHDVIAMDNRFNILVMDEAFESLDEDNVDTVMEMLQEKSTGISIHLITHIQRLATTKVKKTTNLKLINGKTVLA